MACRERERERLARSVHCQSRTADRLFGVRRGDRSEAHRSWHTEREIRFHGGTDDTAANHLAVGDLQVHRRTEAHGCLHESYAL